MVTTKPYCSEEPRDILNGYAYVFTCQSGWVHKMRTRGSLCGDEILMLILYLNETKRQLEGTNIIV